MFAIGSDFITLLVQKILFILSIILSRVEFFRAVVFLPGKVNSQFNNLHFNSHFSVALNEGIIRIF